MNVEERRAKWIEALRSGKYKQAKGQLRVLFDEAEGIKSFGYCCLGVACDVLKDDLKGYWGAGNYFSYPTEDDKWNLDTGLNHELQEYLGITFDQHEDLIRLNDSKGCDFNTIARAIEAFAELSDRLFPDSED